MVINIADALILGLLLTSIVIQLRREQQRVSILGPDIHPQMIVELHKLSCALQNYLYWSRKQND